jgi:ABC-2 type transport system permease protein
LRGLYVIAKKDAMIYYLKPPVFIFGVLFPIFFFLAFAIGREVPPEKIVPGMLAMALFFTASAVGPLVTPWERRAKTYERLISSPVSPLSIILGDILAGACFGAGLSLIPLALGTTLTRAPLINPAFLLPGIVLSALCFAALGELLAAPPTNNPSQVMMLSTLVRLPVIFISGVFVPLAGMPAWMRSVVPISPLSYCSDLVRCAFGSPNYFPIWLDLLMLVAFTSAFVFIALLFHRRARQKGL